MLEHHPNLKIALRIAGKLSTAFLLGVIYYIIVTLKPFGFEGFKCYIRETTGLLCPGCGITHMFVDLIHFRFADAFHDNPVMFIIGPLVIIEVIYIMWLFETKRPLPKWNMIAIYVYVGVLIIFMILRNLPAFTG